MYINFSKPTTRKPTDINGGVNKVTARNLNTHNNVALRKESVFDRLSRPKAKSEEGDYDLVKKKEREWNLGGRGTLSFQ